MNNYSEEPEVWQHPIQKTTHGASGRNKKLWHFNNP